MRRCHCGEVISDVENGVRTCGHFDDEAAEHYAGKRVVANPADGRRARFVADEYGGLPVQLSPYVVAGFVFVMDPAEDRDFFLIPENTGRLW